MQAVKKLTIALGLALAASTAYATDPVPINPQGAGNTITVGSLGWNNGFTMSLNTSGPNGIAVGDTTTAFGHGALANFNDADFNTIGGTNLNTAFEWTYVFGLTEELVSGPAVPGTGTSTFHTVAGDTNFFRLYYDTSRNSNPLNGTGFNDGTLILEGQFLPFDANTGIGATIFQATGLCNTVGCNSSLDQAGVNNYPGIQTVAGNGSLNLLASVTFANAAFFPSAPSIVSVTANGFLNLPFQQTNPSGCYFDGSSLQSAVGPHSGGGNPACATTNTVGAINGVSGPNTAFETRATSAFNTAAIPEPGTIALVGISLIGLGWVARRRT